MKVPDKIYLFKNPISETPDDRWLTKRSSDEDIKYIRADIFIKKVCKWLEINFNMPNDFEYHFRNAIERWGMKQEDKELIRKDTLLDWIKQQLSFEHGFEDGEAEHGYIEALKDVENYLKCK